MSEKSETGIASFGFDETARPIIHNQTLDQQLQMKEEEKEEVVVTSADLHVTSGDLHVTSVDFQVTSADFRDNQSPIILQEQEPVGRLVLFKKGLVRFTNVIIL